MLAILVLERYRLRCAHAGLCVEHFALIALVLSVIKRFFELCSLFWLKRVHTRPVRNVTGVIQASLRRNFAQNSGRHKYYASYTLNIAMRRIPGVIRGELCK